MNSTARGWLFVAIIFGVIACIVGLGITATQDIGPWWLHLAAVLVLVGIECALIGASYLVEPPGWRKR